MAAIRKIWLEHSLLSPLLPVAFRVLVPVDLSNLDPHCRHSAGRASEVCELTPMCVLRRHGRLDTRVMRQDASSNICAVTGGP
jgi:hypothetical protein